MQKLDLTELKSYCALARSRAAGLPVRVLCYGFGAATGAIFAPIWLAIACLSIVLGAEFVERRAVRRVLSAFSAGGAGAVKPAEAHNLRATLLVTEATVAATLAAIWFYTSDHTKILPLCLFVIPVIGIIQTGHRVAGLMFARQGLYLGSLSAMAISDVLRNVDPTIVRVATDLLPVFLLAVVALTVTRSRGMAYQRRLSHEEELARARDDSLRALEAKGRFIATVSHELRTSLNGVLGMAQTLLSTDLDSRQRQQAEVIAESGRSLNTLLNDILDYSKLEVGKLTIERLPEDIRQSVEHIAWLHGAAASQKGLELRIEVAPDVPSKLMIDAVRVRQCLSNLISNAIKFTDEGSVEISISSERSGTSENGMPSYLITAIVADTGIGIPPDRAKRLFQPFTQADGSISRRFGGTGLGLSITRQLAESMNGSVTLESTPGEGTTFRLLFQAEGVSPAAPRDDKHLGESLSEQRVLVADDAATNRIVMRLFLKPLGIEVTEVADGKAAIAALNRSEFDAALLDIKLPGIDGAQIARHVRNGAAPNVALVAISCDSAAETIDTGESGFDGVVTKPIDPSQLIETLTSAIQRRSKDGASQSGDT